MRENSDEGMVTRASYSVSGIPSWSASMSISFMSYSAIRSESLDGGVFFKKKLDTNAEY